MRLEQTWIDITNVAEGWTDCAPVELSGDAWRLSDGAYGVHDHLFDSEGAYQDFCSFVCSNVMPVLAKGVPEVTHTVCGEGWTFTLNHRRNNIGVEE